MTQVTRKAAHTNEYSLGDSPDSTVAQSNTVAIAPWHHLQALYLQVLWTIGQCGTRNEARRANQQASADSVENLSFRISGLLASKFLPATVRFRASVCSA